MALGGVTISRRSAAGGCATAHPDARSPRGAVRTIKSMSDSGKIWRLTGDYRGNNIAKIF